MVENVHREDKKFGCLHLTQTSCFFLSLSNFRHLFTGFFKKSLVYEFIKGIVNSKNKNDGIYSASSFQTYDFLLNTIISK